MRGAIRTLQTCDRLPRLFHVTFHVPSRRRTLSLFLLTGLLYQAHAQSAPSIPFPFRSISRHLMVEAHIGDSGPLWLVVDTGAGITGIDMRRAKELNLDLAGSIAIRGAGAETTAGAYVRNAKFRLTPDSIAPQPITLALPLDRLEPFFGHKVDGILGYDFLSRYVTEIDYQKQRFTLHPRDTFTYDGPGEAVPMTLKNGHPHIRARVRAADRTVEGDFVIDIGSGGGIGLTRGFCETYGLYDAMGPTIASDFAGGIGGRSSGRVARAAALEIGSAVIEKPLLTMSEDRAGALSANTSFEGNLGNLILSRFRMFLDYSRKRIIFERVDAPEPKENWSGVTFSARPPNWEAFTVTDITPGRAAEKAGLRVGDLVRTVEGQTVAGMNFDDFRSLFVVDEMVRELTVERAGEEVRIRLEMKRLL